MILIAGGQFDPNINVLVERLSHRAIGFYDLRIGPESKPSLRIDFQARRFTVDGEPIAPKGCFIRHDVFLYKSDHRAAAEAGALNWYQAIRGWLVSQPSVRLFNRYSYLRENNKIQNLLEAQEIGLSIPRTIVTNDFDKFGPESSSLIQKPAAGGEYTGLLKDLQGEIGTELTAYPRFIQPRLERPEMRIYRIGPTLIGFWLKSPELDYRQTQDVEIEPAPVPPAIGEKLLLLCDRLDLDFAAADFMADENGELQFLEVNSQPMFAAFDRISRGQVCDAIINHLNADAC